MVNGKHMTQVLTTLLTNLGDSVVGGKEDSGKMFSRSRTVFVAIVNAMFILAKYSNVL